MKCAKPCKRFPFRLSCLRKHAPDNMAGVYGFWYGKYCIYVGMTEKQSLRDRLMAHWDNTHNHTLRLWIDAKRDNLLVSFRSIPDPKNAATYERYYIRRFQPVANVIRYQ